MPSMNDDAFFRQATMAICGELEFDKALLSIMSFLRQEMPVDRLFLQYSEVGLDSLRTIAIVTPEKGMVVDQLVPLSKATIAEMHEMAEEFKQLNPRFVWLFRDDPYNLTTREYFGFYKVDITSLLVMPMMLGSKFIGGGSIFLITEGEKKFTQEHADLLSLIREPIAMAMSNALKHRDVTLLKDRLNEDNKFLRSEMHRISGNKIIGADFGLKHVMELVQQVAPTTSPVFLLGETGTGKDVIANAIHLSSPRSKKAFVTVNSGAIPEALIDSELFGHEKGAFTGAVSMKRGRFERAHLGTIFLDEIGELPPQMQVRLLRVLQNHEIERVGGTKSIPVDVRVIAATHRNLEELIAEGRFREDLWFRLNVFPIVIPPLRSRTGDIPALVQHFIETKSKQFRLPTGIELAPGEMDRLKRYPWPGNVRELGNVVERALILNRDGPLEFALHPTDAGDDASAVSPEPNPPEGAETLDAVIDDHIRRVLEMTAGKINGKGGAAEVLGMNPSTLRNRR